MVKRQVKQGEQAMQTAVMALRSAMIVNGCAAISLLTLTVSNLVAIEINCLAVALRLFGLGVLSAALAAGAAFLAQRRCLTELRNTKITRQGKRVTKISFALLVVSYLAFFLGIVTASQGFGS